MSNLLERHCQRTGRRLDLVRQRIAEDEHRLRHRFHVAGVELDAQIARAASPAPATLPTLSAPRLAALIRENPDLFRDALLELLAPDIAEFIRNRLFTLRGGRA
jgi:hypothetical protein